MKRTFLFNIFSSKYCVALFAAFFLASWFLVPHSVLHGGYVLLAILFAASFALTATCIIRNIKERIALARTYGTSLIGLLAAVVGLSALQVCGIAMPICGASIGFGIVASLFPEFFFHFLSHWSIAIVIVSIILQWISLYFMNCFKRIPKI